MTTVRPITVCIPTFRRQRELLDAIHSVVRQSVWPAEILVGDDAGDVGPGLLQAAANGIPVRLFQSHQSGQGANINRLVAAVNTEWLVLLHDDDWLLEGALECLWRARQVHQVDAVFGRQKLSTAGGEILVKESNRHNGSYFRSGRNVGQVLSARESALVQQFPNDGFLLRTALARTVPYREYSEIGTNRWLDFDFALRLAASGKVRFHCVDEFTAVFRLSEVSVSRSAPAPDYLWNYLQAYPIDRDGGWAKRLALGRMAPKMVRVRQVTAGTREAFYLLVRCLWRRQISLPMGARLTGALLVSALK